MYLWLQHASSLILRKQEITDLGVSPGTFACCVVYMAIKFMLVNASQGGTDNLFGY